MLTVSVVVGNVEGVGFVSTPFEGAAGEHYARLVADETKDYAEVVTLPAEEGEQYFKDVIDALILDGAIAEVF